MISSTGMNNDRPCGMISKAREKFWRKAWLIARLVNRDAEKYRQTLKA